MAEWNCGTKSNFRRATRKLVLKTENLYHDDQVAVKERNLQVGVIHDIHRGIGESDHSKVLATHLGKNSVFQKLSERFLWYSMANDVYEFIRKCEKSRKQSDIKPTKVELKSIAVSVMKQMTFDLCTLPEIDEYRQITVFNDYFTKWSETIC